MKFPRIRSKGKQSTDLFADRAFTPRQVTAMVVALGLAVVLFPVGARAASSLLNVVITDPGGTNKATVESGNLHVNVANTPNVNVTNTPSVNQSGTWTVGINSSATTPVSVTSADDPGRSAFVRELSLSFDASSTAASNHFDVPPNTRLVIRWVSGAAGIPTGQKLTLMSVATTGGGQGAVYVFAPTFTGPYSTLVDEFAAGQETLIYADAGSRVGFEMRRSDGTGVGGGNVTISGYLITCSVSSCN